MQGAQQFLFYRKESKEGLEDASRTGNKKNPKFKEATKFNYCLKILFGVKFGTDTHYQMEQRMCETNSLIKFLKITKVLGQNHSAILTTDKAVSCKLFAVSQSQV